MFLVRIRKRPSAEPAPAAPAVPSDEADLVERLRAGDEAAFATLVDRYHNSMVRLARAYVPTDAVAEEVAQETWVGVLRGIRHFEGRSALRTWIFRILVNQAKTHGARERRVAADEPLVPEPAVDPRRFERGAWSRPPTPWSQAEERLLAAETGRVVQAAIEDLPSLQRQVISLRDVAGLDAGEVCRILEVTDGNQRVLLHRARSRVRGALERYMEDTA